MIQWALIALCSFFLYACTGMEESERDKMREKNQKGEFIYRLHNQYFFQTPTPHFHSKEPYPWERSFVGTQPKITKEFFRCNGSGLNPSRIVQDGKEAVHYFDCGGVDKHSLPLRDGKEFIYPVLIDLLNLIQAKTGKKVVITSAYRCPEHNAYVDPSPANQFSKHLIGAEVDFYVQGMENSPEKIIKMIMQYYSELFPDQKDYANFERYDRLDTNVSIPPWYNKEIYIKLFQKHEGRNFDNRHPYPYISIQVRYDRERKEKVNYSWDQANRNYLRK